MSRPSEPVDSLFGFEVLQRTHPVPRKQYAMAAVALVFDRNVAAGAPNSRPSVERLITQLGEQLKRDPSRLAEIQREYCCIEPFAFSEGPVYPEVAKIFDRMNIGEMMTTPVESGVQLILAKRLDPATIPVQPARLDSSFREPADAAAISSTMDRQAAWEQIDSALDELIATSGLAAGRADAVRELLATPWRQENVSVEERSSALRSMDGALRDALGPASHAMYTATLQRRLERLILHGRT